MSQPSGTSGTSRHAGLAPASGPLQVAIVSADPLVRAGLASILEPELGAGRIVEDLDQADVALWDLGATSEQVLGRLDQIDTAGVPVLAILPSAAFAGPALDAGVGGVLLRDRLGEGLAAALDAVRHGFVVLDAALAAAVIEAAPEAVTAGTGRQPGGRGAPNTGDGDDLDDVGDADEPGVARDAGRPDEPGIDALTARERQVIELLAQGLSNRRIAGALSISEHTAKFHVNSILSKLGASTRTEAVVEAVRRGLVLL
ncbi:MAG TPA: response regulator transcription factor [Haliangium sp.]|nr:response regulator transcription factor [Haliangium sp.]